MSNMTIPTNIWKIKKKYFNDLMNGKKLIEVRKMNKDHITPNMNIVFKDMKTGKLLGSGVLYIKIYRTPQDMLLDIRVYKHRPTLKFIKKHYMNEDKLIGFCFCYLERKR